MYGIVAQSGGYIWVYSERGQGTSFKLYFPVTGAAVDALPQRTGVAGQAASQTILVVEDELAIRANVRDCLRQLGYDVLKAESGEAALQICERCRKKIDLVMTDLIMPGIGGQELSQRLAERFTRIQILFTSGYAADSVARRELLRAGSSFLTKPFSVAELSSAVHGMLTRQPDQPAEAISEEVEVGTA